MSNKKGFLAAGAILFLLLLTSGIGIYIYLNSEWGSEPGSRPTQSGDIATFQNEIEFKNYIMNAESANRYDTFGFGDIDIDMMVEDSIAPTLSSKRSSDEGDTTTGNSQEADASRYSQTNVQVLSIDESDMVKTDGDNIYYSPLNDVYYYYGLEEMGMREPDYDYTSKTYIIDALPVADASVLSEIEDSGDLYLQGDRLVLEGYNYYKGYDISKETSPELVWSYELESGQNVVSSRMYQGDLYIVTGMYPQTDIGCVIPTLIDEIGNTIDVKCTDIYYPTDQLSSVQTISIFKIDVENGDLISKTSFLGGSWNTVVYMSKENIYVTYPQEAEIFSEIYAFIMQNPEIFTKAVLDRAALINSYDISSDSKMSEIESLLDKFALSLTDDDRLKFENDLNNEFQAYLKDNIRSFGGTGIVKIAVEDLTIQEHGIVQGELLNQFALDEYEGNLRVATTRSGGWYGRWFSGQIETANDVVVLNEDLDIIGEVTDLGLTESIYSVRFMGDMGYVVTFRQIDPFYVLDLSDPSNPEMKGELKIPGYSSYLHPIANNTILGVGMEDNRVKLSLFDVSRPSDPVEVSKYSLNEYWTDVSDNHHAFMQDPEHEIFFIPGGSGGYIFSYAKDSLSLVKAIADNSSVNRALYINDFLYVMTNDSVIIYDEITWEEVRDLSLRD